jgi:hypothetical protein
VGLLAQMVAPHAELTASEEYASARMQVRTEFSRHLDQATREILSRVE